MPSLVVQKFPRLLLRPPASYPPAPAPAPALVLADLAARRASRPPATANGASSIASRWYENAETASSSAAAVPADEDAPAPAAAAAALALASAARRSLSADDAAAPNPPPLARLGGRSPPAPP